MGTRSRILACYRCPASRSRRSSAMARSSSTACRDRASGSRRSRFLGRLLTTTTSHRPLPVRTEEITREWLTAALRTRHPEVTVHDFRIVDIIHATTTKIRLKVELDDRGKRAGIPDLLILKGGFEPHSRLLCQMHEREVRGYRDVLPIVKLPSPKCFFADYDAERQQGIIIMDDLVARGVTFCNALQPQTHEQIARRLTLLAQF